MNYRVPKTRKEIFETLIRGLQRLEYRGYDSAGRSLGIPHNSWFSYPSLFFVAGTFSALEFP